MGSSILLSAKSILKEDQHSTFGRMFPSLLQDSTASSRAAEVFTQLRQPGPCLLLATLPHAITCTPSTLGLSCHKLQDAVGPCLVCHGLDETQETSSSKRILLYLLTTRFSRRRRQITQLLLVCCSEVHQLLSINMNFIHSGAEDGRGSSLPLPKTDS